MGAIAILLLIVLAGVLFTAVVEVTLWLVVLALVAIAAIIYWRERADGRSLPQSDA